MTLLLSNDDVAATLTMAEAVAAIEAAYRGLAAGSGVCRPRIDLELPTAAGDQIFRWGTMEGGGEGYFAIRLKSDVVFWRQEGGAVRRGKYCVEPGRYCGLVFLFSTKNGEPLALINDGILQHVRVGADSAIGARLLARQDAAVVGMLGSGGMARSHVEAFLAVRKIARLQVFSPTRANRERFAAEMAERHGLEAVAVDEPAGVYRGADILAAVTDSTTPVIEGERLEPGTHVVNIGGGGRPDEATLGRIDVYLRLGTAPSPRGRPHLGTDDEHIAYAAPDAEAVRRRHRKARGEEPHGVLLPDRMTSLADLVEGRHPGRTSDRQITYSERGNIQGAQFWAVAAVVYEKARALGLGREIPTAWLLQTIRN